MSPKLKGSVIARSALNEKSKAEMFKVFQGHYDQGRWETFTRDLAEKDWVILLLDELSQIQGFTTLTFYETEVTGSPISVVYSGDTIISPTFWGTSELPRIWIRTVLEVGNSRMKQPLYWLLISSGYKTYRFLPVFYREYYPCYNQPTPARIKLMMDQLAGERFGPEYLADEGIVRFRERATPLRAGLAEIKPERLQDPHVAYFVARNPNHREGDELVCLTHIHPENLTAAGRRMLR